MKLFGIVGWSGSGKTTLVEKLIPEFAAFGLRVSTVKHTHHDIEIDRTGKDSDRHRRAGATEVLVTSPYRWALVHELGGDEQEPELGDLVLRMAPVDLLLVEGFKSYPFSKLEVHRPALGKPVLCCDDPTIVAVASDGEIPDLAVPRLDLNDVPAVARFILSHCGLSDRRARATA